MTTQKMLNYDDIQTMQNIALEYEANGEGSVYGELVQEYCGNALEYVEMMNGQGLEADFSLESLAGIFLAIVFFTADGHAAFGMDAEEALARAKNKIAGYVMFSNYNSFVQMGCRVDVQVNDFETGLNLIITDDKGGEMVYDVEESLDRAFEFVDMGVEDTRMAIRFEHDEFINNLLDAEGGDSDVL